MAESSPVFVWTTDRNGVVTYLNGTWQRFTGRGAPFNQSHDACVHEDDRDDLEYAFWRAHETNAAFQSRYRLRRFDGVYRWVQDQGAPLLGPGGELVGYVGSAMDVTEQEEARHALARSAEELEVSVRDRTAALERSHRQLRLSERMAALGTLSAGLGHDMGNLLLPVRLRLETLLTEHLTAHARGDVEAIAACVEHLQRLASGLRLFTLDAADNEASEGTTHVERWWSEVQTFLKNAVPKGVTLSTHLSKTVPELGVPRHQLTQAVFNLIQNAGDALGHGSSGNVEIHLAPAGAGWAELTVSDDGPGMPEEVRQRCLEPFFSTKTRKLSTGLGLALVQGVVKSVNGQIAVQSSPGRGTRVVLTLPTDGARPVSAEPLLAFVSVQDARRSAFIVSVLNGMGLCARPMMEAKPPRGARLWVLDGPAEAAEEFAAGGCVAVLVADEGLDAMGVVRMERGASASAIREVLQRAVGKVER